MPLDPQRQEELPAGEVSQLETRPQRGANNVLASQDWKDGAVHDGPGRNFLRFVATLIFDGGERMFLVADSESAGGVSGARSGPPRHQQRVPVQSDVSAGRALFHIDHGTPSSGSVRHDPQRGFQQHPPGRLRP